jgi:hypothetical protein
MAGPTDLFSIVVAGAMNPRIHHPAWYSEVKILTPEEARLATAGPLVCTPVVSQFQFEGYAILCTGERWEIQTPDARKLDRMLDIAGRTFDTLIHTPVSAFGLNFHFARPTGLQNVGKRLAEMINRLPFGREAAENDTALIVTTIPGPNRVLLETISGVPEALDHLRVVFNAHHPIRAESALFELTPLLQAAFSEDYPECLDRAEKVAKSFAGPKKE